LSEFMLEVCPAYTDTNDEATAWLIAALAIDWSNCVHSSIRRVLSKLSSSRQMLHSDAAFC